jgi:acyl carrier protein
MDWQRYGITHPSPFLSHLVRQDDLATDAGSSVRERLQQAGPGERKTLLVGILVELVAEVLRLSRNEVAPRERLFDLGVDSLIAVELKNRLQSALGLVLSTTLLFDYPTIEALTGYLLAELAPATAPAVELPAAGLDSLSEEEAEFALLAQLEQLEGRA